MRRWLLLVLLATFFAQNQCALDKDDQRRRKENFFVSRTDTKEAICVGYRWQLPTFNLDELEFPVGAAIVDWSWHSDWQWDNKRLQYEKVLANFIAGDHPFQSLGHLEDVRYRYMWILASNISLWMTFENSTEQNGFLFELDHWNETTRVKDTTMKFCDRMPDETNAECTIIDYKNGTNFLNDGNDWAYFESNGDLQSFKIGKKRNGNQKSVTQWKSKIHKLPSNIGTGRLNQLFGKSHKRNAAYIGYGHSYNLDYLSNVEMKRNYTHRNQGKLCIKIEWRDSGNRDGSSQNLEAKNLLTGRVELSKMFNYYHFGYLSTFEFDELDAGNYEIKLRFSERMQPADIDLCRDDNFWKTWIQIPKKISKCQFYLGWKNEFSAWPSSTMKPELNPDWNLDEWAYVCDRLGIGSNDTQVEIKFCNFYGCNFSKCPHLQDDPPYLVKSD